jgi:hypothetical protein
LYFCHRLENELRLEDEAKRLEEYVHRHIGLTALRESKRLHAFKELKKT